MGNQSRSPRKLVSKAGKSVRTQTPKHWTCHPRDKLSYRHKMEYKAAVTGLSAEEVAEVRKQPDRLVKRKKEPGPDLNLIHYGLREVAEAIEELDDDCVKKTLVLTEEDPDKIEEALQKKEEEQKEQSLRIRRLDYFKQIGPKHGILPKDDDYPAKWLLLHSDNSERGGFPNRRAYEMMSDYLEANGDLALHTVPGNGNCLLKALRLQMSVRQRHLRDLPFFPNRYFRRFLVMCLVKHYLVILDRYTIFLASTYDGSDPEVGGPFTYKEYCKHMLQDRSWGDEVLLYAFALECKAAIMVVLPNYVYYPITKPFAMDDTDFLLVHNGKDHFSAGVLLKQKGKDVGQRMLTPLQGDRVTKSEYRKAHDSDTEPDGNSTEEEEELWTRTERQMHKRKPSVRKSYHGYGTKRTGKKSAEHDPDYDPDEDEDDDQGGGGPNKRQKLQPGQVAVDKKTLESLLSRAEAVSQTASDVQKETGVRVATARNPLRLPEINATMKVCPVCDKKVHNYYTLKKHYKVHQGATDFNCPRCGRYMSSEASVTQHLTICKEYQCDRNDTIIAKDKDGNEVPEEVACEKVFTTPQSLKNHITQHHDKAKYAQRERKHPCPYGCGIKFSTPKQAKTDHGMFCKKNPDKRGPFFCLYPNCPKAKGNEFEGYKRNNVRNTHMSKKHGHLAPKEPTEERTEEAE